MEKKKKKFAKTARKSFFAILNNFRGKKIVRPKSWKNFPWVSLWLCKENFDEIFFCPNLPKVIFSFFWATFGDNIFFPKKIFFFSTNGRPKENFENSDQKNFFFWKFFKNTMKWFSSSLSEKNFFCPLPMARPHDPQPKSFKKITLTSRTRQIPRQLTLLIALMFYTQRHSEINSHPLRADILGKSRK